MSGALWTSHDAETATGGTNTGPWSATGISIDTRTLQPGDLFVALSGPSFDGHDFVADAFAKGAAAAIVNPSPRWGREGPARSFSEGWEGEGKSIPPHPTDYASLRQSPSPIGERDNLGPLLIVEDTLQGLRDLAKFARARSKAKIIALTGSVGKTGTKEALRHALSFQGETHASAASLNNHWGAPLSLALLPPTAQYAIFELGMNHPGEIEPLSKLVRPHVAIVLNVEAVHLGPMGSLAAIADAKAEIFAGLTLDGHTIVKASTNHADRIIAASPVTPFTFATNSKVATAYIKRMDASDTGSNVTAHVIGIDHSYRVPIPGAHHAENSLAVLLAVAAVGADVAEAATTYRSLPPLTRRGDRSTVPIRGGHITLIDETHNASPIATSAALKVLGMIKGGRRIAVLGDMLELGPESQRFHAALAPDIIAAGVDLAFLSGSDMAHLFAALPPGLRGAHAPDSTALLPLLAAQLRDGDIVLVKGSRGAKMKVITDALKGAVPTHAL